MLDSSIKGYCQYSNGEYPPWVGIEVVPDKPTGTALWDWCKAWCEQVEPDTVVSIETSEFVNSGSIVNSPLITYQLTLMIRMLSRLSIHPTQPFWLVYLGLVALLEPTAQTITNASETW